MNQYHASKWHQESDADVRIVNVASYDDYMLIIIC